MIPSQVAVGDHQLPGGGILLSEYRRQCDRKMKAAPPVGSALL